MAGWTVPNNMSSSFVCPEPAGRPVSPSSALRLILVTTPGWRPASTLAPATRGARNRNLASVSDQPAAGSSALTLAALRQARASREALLRRILPVGLGALVIVVVTTSRAKPGAGLHGASLGVTLALAGFGLAALAGFCALVRAPDRVPGSWCRCSPCSW